jgi:hypothetical protein
MFNSHLVRAQAVRERLLAIVHDSAERADLSLEVCVADAPDGGMSVNLVITTRPVTMPTDRSVSEVLRALQDQAELLLHDVQDFETQLKNVKMSDTQTGIYLAQADNQILFASTSLADTEDYVEEHRDLIHCEQTFVPIALEDIPQTLRELATQRVDVPECRDWNVTRTQTA